MKDRQTIAQMTGGIILSSFEKEENQEIAYQSEAQMEHKLMENLVEQGYERLIAHSKEDLYKNLKVQIEKLNEVTFSPSEWKRFLHEYLDSPNDTIIDKTRKVQDNHIYAFQFDDGSLKNIKIIDKQNISNNFLQVVNQLQQKGNFKNIYDVSILINGLPLVHIELKKRGISIKEAFNQIHRYSKESFNTDESLYKYVQIFIISNGTLTRYFANTTERDKNNFQFTCEWADAKNRTIRDLEDFSKTFLEKRVLLEVLTKYCVFTTQNILLVMRPYQIVATERILWKIKSNLENKKWTNLSGGFIWHTTGSGKTLTSFKVARLVSQLQFIEKVFFVVDRKDLDYQTMVEYERYQPGSVNGSKDTKELKKNIEKNDGNIVVTTIQKLNEFVKRNKNHVIYEKNCVFIFDECHRSQFGEAQRNIGKRFRKYYQFGFTGTPIFSENSLYGMTTADVFGAQLHSYVITDAICDGKVLKFLVDYINVIPRFRKAEENEEDIKTEYLKIEHKVFLHPERIASITKYILKHFNEKTHRNIFETLENQRKNGFNAMFAVHSIEAAKLYYEEFKKQQDYLPADRRLKVATIYSFAANEAQSAIGDIADEGFEATALSSSNKEFLQSVIQDYNKVFNVNFSLEGENFQNYYKDLSKKVKTREVDLLIVVGMFLTGFDAPTLNTLFVDKPLRHHGLIQAFSRTNRIFNNVKSFGNIVCFRKLEKATHDAIKIFGDKNSINIILEKSYDEYINGFKDERTGECVRGFKDISNELLTHFQDPRNLQLESEKKAFVKLFGDFLHMRNILRNFDAFENFETGISERQLQDMKSVYIAIREDVVNASIHNDDAALQTEKGTVDFSDIEFQMELLKTDEINLDYILTLMLEKFRENDDMEGLKDEVRRLIRSSFGIRAKEELVIDFIDNTDLNNLITPHAILDAFYSFAKEKKENAIAKIIDEEKLKEGAAHFIEKSIKKGYVETQGIELDSILKPTSRMGNKGETRDAKKRGLLSKLKKLVQIFVGV